MATAVGEYESAATSPAFGSMCAYVDDVKWRHRPLGKLRGPPTLSLSPCGHIMPMLKTAYHARTSLPHSYILLPLLAVPPGSILLCLAYYCFSHLVGKHIYTPTVMQGQYGFEHRRQGALSYWYRSGKMATAAAPGKATATTGATGTAAGDKGGATSTHAAPTTAAGKAAASETTCSVAGGAVVPVETAAPCPKCSADDLAHGVLRIRDGVISTVQSNLQDLQASAASMSAAAASSMQSAEHSAPAPEALVFIHGVGFGPAPYAAFIDSIAGPETPVVPRQRLKRPCSAARMRTMD